VEVRDDWQKLALFTLTHEHNLSPLLDQFHHITPRPIKNSLLDQCHHITPRPINNSAYVDHHHSPPTTDHCYNHGHEHRNRYAWAWGEKEGRIGFDLRYFTAWNYTTLLIVFVLLSFQHIFTYTPQWVSNVTWTLFQVRFRSVLILIPLRCCVHLVDVVVVMGGCEW
jgi:hypothetical protein